MARPAKTINWDVVEKLMESGCPAREIAGFLKINIDTFYDNFKKEFGNGFSDFSDNYEYGGKAAIRLTQYLRALKGNNQMLILLGKERLGQGKDEPIKKPPNDDQIEIVNRNMILEYQNELLKKRLEENGNKSETK